jgi:hypothetical protein
VYSARNFEIFGEVRRCCNGCTDEPCFEECQTARGADADAHKSLERQEAFLRPFIRGLSISSEVVRMVGITAFSTQAIHRLKQSLRNKHKRLNVTTALDR